jgi:hypothetical protein
MVPLFGFRPSNSADEVKKLTERLFGEEIEYILDVRVNPSFVDKNTVCLLLATLHIQMFLLALLYP